MPVSLQGKPLACGKGMAFGIGQRPVTGLQGFGKTKTQDKKVRDPLGRGFGGGKGPIEGMGRAAQATKPFVADPVLQGGNVTVAGLHLGRPNRGDEPCNLPVQSRILGHTQARRKGPDGQ